jgi:purine-nucleoside phosphorylase
MGDEESIAEVNHHEVLMAVKKAEPKMRLLVKELILNI